MARLPSQKLAPLKELRCYHATETSCRRIARSKLGNNHHHLALKKREFEMGNFPSKKYVWSENVHTIIHTVLKQEFMSKIYIVTKLN